MKKLARISVRKLFGTFDYDIDFTKFGGYAILTAPNGYGKSTILRIIHAIANGNFCYFAGLPFECIRAGLLESTDSANGDGKQPGLSELKIEKKKRKVRSEQKGHEAKPVCDLSVAVSPLADVEDEGVPGENHHYKCIVTLSDDWNFTFTDEDIENSVIPMIVNIGDYERIYTNSSNHRNFWVDSRDGSVQDLAGIFNRSPAYFRRLFPKTLEWVRLVGLNCTYIGTDRLYLDGTGPFRRRYSSESDDRRFERMSVRSLQVSEISHEISNAHFRCMRMYLDKSRKLEGDFVSRVIEKLNDGAPNKAELRKSIKEKSERIQKMEERCASYGIVKRNIGEAVKRTQSEHALVVLDMFLDDVMEKMRTYDDLLERLDLLKNSLNDLLEMKSVEIWLSDDDESPVSDRNEFTVRNKVTAQPIPLGALSSGEQHLIVLLGKLLFGTRRGGIGIGVRKNLLTRGKDSALVLIDEPELSFHPGWQERFGNVLDEIRKKYNVDFVAATHSPSFISNRWENTIELADQVAHQG